MKKLNGRVLAALVASMGVVALSAPAAQAQLVVNSDDTGQGSLRQEIIDTPPGGTVTFQSASIDPQVESEIMIDKSLTVRGLGMNATEIERGGFAVHRLFNIGSVNDSIIVNFVDVGLKNGAAPDGADNNGGAGGPGADGGAILNDGLLSLTRVRTALNEAGNGGDGTGAAGGEGGSGGAIANTGTLQVTDSAIVGGAGDGGAGSPGGVGGGGGAIFSTGVLIVRGSELSGGAGTGGVGFNNVGGEGGSGGAIQIAGGGTALIERSGFRFSGAGNGGSGTTSEGGGGGAIHSTGDSMLLKNSTLALSGAGDGATTDGMGGGLLVSDSDNYLTNVTIADIVPSPPAFGTNLAVTSGTAELRNTLITRNTAAAEPLCEGIDPIDAGGNLAFPSGTGCPASFSPGDPNLTLNSFYGNFTSHNLLGPGSAAIDAAPCTDSSGDPVTTDQRGVPRPATGCDIGAIEIPAPAAGSGTPVGVAPTPPAVAVAKRCKRKKKRKPASVAAKPGKKKCKKKKRR